MKKFSKTTWLIMFCAIFLLVATFFFYQWWQVKSRLARQIKQNVNLTKQVNELQKEIEELKTSKLISWKTYRNKEYGIEIDYPVIGWKFEEYYRGAPTMFSLCKQQDDEEQKEEEEVCIYVTVETMYEKCYGLSWGEIIIDAYDCLGEYFHYMYFEKEILTNSGIKGGKGKGDVGGGYDIEGVFFLIPEKLIHHRHPVVFIHYYLTWDHKQIERGPEEIETFNKVVSTFRFIEE